MINVSLGDPQGVMDRPSLQLRQRNDLIERPLIGMKPTDRQGEILKLDDFAFGRDERPMQHILELANVTRPCISDQSIHSFGRDPLNRSPHVGGKGTKRSMGKLRNITHPIPKGR